MASEPFKPCPFCAATLSPCEDKGVVFWMHPGVITDDDCVLSGRGFYPKELPAWNRRAAVAELVEAAGAYMSAFGQALDAHDIAYGPQQQEADQRLREAISRHQAGLGKGDERG